MAEPEPVILPDYVLAMIQASGDPERWLNGVPDTGHPASCDNCNDFKSIIITHLLSQLSGMPKRATYQTIFHDGKYWRCTTINAPCPVCSPDDDMVDEIMQQSGLIGAEQSLNFHQNYLPIEGKKIARDTGLALLKKLGEAHGLVTLYGDYGRGKSFWLKSMVASFIRLGVPARYYVAMDWLNEITSTFDDKTQSVAGMMNETAAYHVLAIDELEQVPTSNWHRSTLFSFLDRRYRMAETRLTLLVLNSDPQNEETEFKKIFGYLASRMSAGIFVQVLGDDLRPLQGEQLDLALKGGE